MSQLLDPQHLAKRRLRLMRQVTDLTSEDRYVASQLLGTMEASPSLLALRSSDPEADDIVRAIKASPRLTKRHFLAARELDCNGDWTHRISIQSFKDDPPLNLPLANFVSAEGMQDWTTGRGSVIKKIEESTGVARSSSATVQVYAKRNTEAPPIESVIGYVQPNGTVLFVTAQGSHCTAAAIARATLP